jgi:hypothetical protein
MKHNYDFLKQNKAIDGDEVALLLLEWQQNLLNNDDLRIRLTDFVVHRHEVLRHEESQKNPKSQSYVVRVMGYQTIVITPISSYVVCCYSPLAKTFIGNADPIGYSLWHTRRIIQLTCGLAVADLNLSPLDPLTDDQTKRLLMASDNDYWFRKLCMLSRESGIRKASSVYVSMQIDDPTLAMVKYIRTVLPESKRKTLMDVYDTYGPIDSVVGDALIHIDKFRSL